MSGLGAIALASVGCGGGSNGEQLNAPPQERAATEPAPAAPSRSPQPVDRAERGVPLPLAGPADSALFHAAYQRVEDDWQQVLFLCDGIGGERVKLVTMPNARGLSTLWTYAKPGFGTDREWVRVGDQDAGAGQIGRPIEREDGTAVGAARSINPGMLGDAAATSLPTLSSITDKAETTQCRWLPRGRVLLVDSRRTVLVTAEPDGSYTYRSFDHATPGEVVAPAGGGRSSRPTVTITGGRLVPSDPGRESYRFDAPPWLYLVRASADNRAPGASLEVRRDGELVQTSVAAAYQMAARRIE